MRRNSINAFFSNASIRRVEPIVRENLQKMLARWDESGKDGKVLEIHPIFKAYASDIITTYAFGDCCHFLEMEDWGKSYFESTNGYFALTHVFGHFPVVMRLVNSVPTRVLALFIPNLTEISEKQTVSVREWRPYASVRLAPRLIWFDRRDWSNMGVAFPGANSA